MTAHTPIRAALPISAAILAGNLPGHRTRPLWDERVWIAAAEAAQDCEDESELVWMIERQRDADAAYELEYALVRNPNAVIDRALCRGCHERHRPIRPPVEGRSKGTARP